MRYPKLPASILRSREISALDGGLAAEGAMNAGDGRLEESENFWWKDGALRSRPGLAVTAGTVREEAPPVRYVVYGGTDESAGSPRKCVVLSWRGEEAVTVTAELITLSADGEETASTVRQYAEEELAFAFFSESGAGSGPGVKEDGALLFFRKRTGGGGFLILAEPLDPEDGWTDVTEQAHVPVLLFGGTGCETPEGDPGGFALEEENLLTPRFHAQYTSGNHPYYRLPKSGLDEAAATVTLRTDEGGTYTYVVAAGSDLSPAAGPYRVHLDREAGVFYFCAAAGDAGTPVLLGNSSVMNNIEATASKDNAAEREPLLGMTACIWFGGWQGVYSGNRLFVGGNPEAPNRMYWSESRLPLYFPRSNYSLVGGAEQAITAFSCLRDALVIFKEREVYRAVRETLEDPVSGREDDLFPRSLLSPTVGCDCPRTIRLCGDRLVWADSAGEVYCLREADAFSGETVIRLTGSIASRLALHAGEELKRAFALRYAGYYLLAVGRDAYCLCTEDDAFRRVTSSGSLTGEALRWFYWDFGGRRLDAGTAAGEKGAFLCREEGSGAGQAQFLYAAALSGELDGRAGGGEERPVLCRLRTAELGLEPVQRQKNLRRLWLTLESAGGTAVVYRTDRGDFADPQLLYTAPGRQEEIRRLSPSLTGVGTLRLILTCRGRTKIGRIVLEYTVGRGAG
ncbi:MAG TPA: hypothetical protein H9684_09120 [Firmicutes bacterium]|nr:hypothetical protein [Bacillota bacterium]